MQTELDIESIITLNRVSRFIQKVQMHTRQRQTLPYSLDYMISDIPIRAERQLTTDELIEGFDPEGNEIDRKILYATTRLKVENGEYSDSDNDDDGGGNMLVLTAAINP